MPDKRELWCLALHIMLRNAETIDKTSFFVDDDRRMSDRDDGAQDVHPEVMGEKSLGNTPAGIFSIVPGCPVPVFPDMLVRMKTTTGCE